MKKIITFLFLVAFLTVNAQEKIDLNYYLPQNVTYNSEIPTPESVIGHQVGEWHISHDKLVHYMQTLAKSSDRITIETRGKTYEDRPILLLTITSPKNHQNIESIRSEHLKLSDASANDVNVSDMPVVVYQGFSIHGNEPSGANAGLLVAYYLAAAEGNEIDELLNNTIILFDPSFNPDGLNRFASWVNVHKNQNVTSDNNDREYDEAWPGGRTNHYWFDMNRDWLVTQLPESQARIKTFHKWKPNILTDHHEMGTNSTFFFQPGIPSRTHPLTPKLNQQLTAKIGEYHAKALDKIGSLYFTEERYDDFYYGKGSTFPDINGGIGILFEQASSRGHAQDTDNGLLTFPFTIRNQFTAALSTLEAGKNMREELLKYQNDFYKEAQNEIKKDRNKAIVFGDAHDKGKTYQFAKMLERQHIKFHKLNGDVNASGNRFSADNSYIIPANQPNYRMIKAMFETRTSFQDSLFYDVSAWTLPMAFDLNYGYTNSVASAGDAVTSLDFPEGKVSSKSDYAYIFEWDEYYTPKALYTILKNDLRAKVAVKPFGIGGKNYDYGTILIPVANQEKISDEIYNLLQQTAKETGVDFNAVNTGIATGIDLGSSYFRILEEPKIAVLVGEGISSYDAGEIWHLLDTRYQMPITKLDTKDLHRADLNKYTTIIMANTSGSTLKDATENLKTFVKNGGVLIGYRNAIRWLDTNKFIELDFKKSKVEAKDVSFADREDFRGAQVIGGAIFEADIDLTHPIGYGYNKDKIALFRNTTLFIKPDSTSNYKNPLQYTKKALLSGYISKENLKAIKETLPFKTTGMGRGQVIAFTDNTNFRAFWYGTNKLLMNSIFFGKLM
ncbi:M14 metallopeptidase family protein [Aureibaculum sp. 2210JD6-5]|uniref:M14 metallopeptidase family protein n=1 Tax=Aureibaculum sp. 2210JD6-5 TaxID=3103957 RepID=UPI002AAEBAF8|nr:M14 metallopeptidase family protein [Aureibaculum sp. 2210JD6-5]MDY7395525.1 M14 metallopeptidase family protein [Aureibaculum sp. 2210JD6-5]